MKSKVRFIGCMLVACSVLLALVGCGASNQGTEQAPVDQADSVEVEAEQEPEQIEAADLVLKECGYTVDNGYIHYAVAIENPNTAYEAEYAVISIVGTDKKGDVVFSDDWTLSSLPCSSTTYWANQAGNGKADKADKIEFDVSVDSDNWHAGEPVSADIFKIEKTKLQKGSVSHSVTGMITLTQEAPEDNYLEPMLVAVMRDADGKILNGDTTYVDKELKVGKSTAFEITYYNVPKGAETVEVHANPW